MFHARIVSQHGSLYFAAEATPYDLESLRMHIQDFQISDAKAVRLELSVDDGSQGLTTGPLASLLRTIEAEGVRVEFIASPVTPAASSGRRH